MVLLLSTKYGAKLIANSFTSLLFVPQLYCEGIITWFGLL